GDDRVEMGCADPADDLRVVGELACARLGLEVTHVDVDDGGSGTGGGDRIVRDLLRGDGHVLALAGGVPGSCDGTGEDDLAVHGDSFFSSVGTVSSVVVVSSVLSGCMVERLGGVGGRGVRVWVAGGQGEAWRTGQVC